MRYTNVVNRIANAIPKTPIDVMRGTGLALRYIGDGAYRSVYQVIGTNLIIKFASYDYCKEHAEKEYQTVTGLKSSKLKRYEAIKKHLPELYYYYDGVTIGKYYKLLPENAYDVRQRFSRKVLSALKVCYGDLQNPGNVGEDEKGILKIIDAGCLHAD